MDIVEKILKLKNNTKAFDQFKAWCTSKKLDIEILSNLSSREAVVDYLKSVRGFADEKFARWCSDHNTQWNDSNFFVSENVNSLSNCCRLRSDLNGLKKDGEKLIGFSNSVGGTALQIGSIKVNTINLVRIAIEAMANKTKNDSKISSINAYLKLLRKRTELCCKLLDVQRDIIQKNVERGLLPNYCDGGIDITHQYSTVGILGLYETIKEFGFVKIDEFGNHSYTDEGIELAKKIFEVINDVKDNFTNKYSFNIESVPAERAAVILCQKDNLLYDRNDDFIYSNQWIPLKEKCTIQEKVRLSGILDDLCSGGAIAHINIESNFPSKEVAWDMLNRIAEKKVIYFAFNNKVNVCKNHHGFVGRDTCPVCGEPVYDQFTRIVGFLTPTKSYSKDRKKEFDARKWYDYATQMKDL